MSKSWRIVALEMVNKCIKFYISLNKNMNFHDCKNLNSVEGPVLILKVQAGKVV